MKKAHISLVGMMFLASTLSGCGKGSGNPAVDQLLSNLPQAQTAGGGGGGGGGNGQGATHGKKGGNQNLVADPADDETCDAGKLADPSNVVLCAVGADGSARQVCTDASTALSKYGLDASTPSLVASDGDHLGAC